MAKLENGQVMSLDAALAGTDSKGKPLTFKETSKGTHVAETDTHNIVVQEQPQNVIVSSVKKESSAAKINDPYYQRIVANAPKVKGENSTEERETKEFGKPAERTDVQKGVAQNKK